MNWNRNINDIVSLLIDIFQMMIELSSGFNLNFMINGYNSVHHRSLNECYQISNLSSDITLTRYELFNIQKSKHDLLVII